MRKKGVGMKSQSAPEILKDKWVLIVDDEEDVLDVLIQILDMCKVDRASTFEQAKELLEKNPYDIAVLDIMGVRGYDLLKIADRRNIPAMMLTAHALTKADVIRSIQEGASFFAPKDKIADIASFLASVLEARQINANTWARWFESLGDFYDKRFGGTDWRDRELEFWEEKLKDWDID
jgi:DNA-binding NtrC family response regulator